MSRWLREGGHVRPAAFRAGLDFGVPVDVEMVPTNYIAMSREHRLPPARWITTAEAAAEIGVSQWWIRQRIEDGLLPATAISTGRHKVYRIRDDDWTTFCAQYTGDALDPRFN